MSSTSSVATLSKKDIETVLTPVIDLKNLKSHGIGCVHASICKFESGSRHNFIVRHAFSLESLGS
jgi:hypothetical protein